ncbi:GNAT family N-acetyltransferase [Bacillus sp. DTU_2020_1000418_1_SI_GHA_SEK_038]|uniref:GNAT family N-acetyltransferase n=1 Tax=Bacillus sp. DTU_2020_1000418_1_SI_GHA_SEK_038 TaxID=3077585 RepID=UPI0028F1122E|nr:GNAT family N-acetyltransferase [Bacillus sp. DTU_2020_1000418_1_SI_GHA_SEK_038]WNS74703.1 GNAT family N-acetyltransferase [Bacillus sp. DTU_2020_1000418_1_SI_GHA_SEK_038]
MGFNKAFTNFPRLETERVILRKLQMNDAPGMFSYFSKEEVTKFYDLATFTSEKQAEDLIESLLYKYENRKQIRWAIVLKETGQFIGTCGFHEIEEEHWKAEIGYELHPDYWGKGIMTEVIHAVVQYGLIEIGLNRIEAIFDPRNSSSKKVLEKNGFEFEGLLKKKFLKKGQFVDGVIAAILKEDEET